MVTLTDTRPLKKIQEHSSKYATFEGLNYLENVLKFMGSWEPCANFRKKIKNSCIVNFIRPVHILHIFVNQ